MSLWDFLPENSVATAQNTSGMHLTAYSFPNTSFNSQNLPILTANARPDYSLAVGGAETSIENGDTLVVKESPLSADTSKNNPIINKSDKIKIYVVRKGDTLSEIAEKFGVSVNTIRWANDLGRKGLIKVGQELLILPVNGVKYKVKKGGTLRDIVKKVGGDVEEAATFNGIDPDKELAAGTEVIIPNGEIKEPKKKAKKVRSYVKSLGKGLPVYKGYYMRPIIGGVRTQGLHGHNAVDLASTYGAAIYAAANGKVIKSKSHGWNGGYGKYIIISHPNGTQTLYAHLSANFVHAGDYVKQGQIIGTEGSSGKSTGTHLHFEIRGARNPF